MKKEKKIFVEPIIEITKFDNEDVITTSGIIAYDPQNILDDDNADDWYN